MLLVVLAIVASSLVQAPHADAATKRPKCLGKKATIVGNKKANTLKGTKKADVIVGLGGNDRILGRGGADRICGGGGKDRIFGGPGNDRMDGGKASDECRQQAGTGLKKNCEGPKFQLAVSKAGSGSGTVTSSPSGIECGLACGQTFVEGQSVTLTATAASGSTFGEWAGGCSGTGSCAVSMSKDQSVIATFTANPAPPPPVNDPPVANDDSASTNEDTAVTVNVVANDTPGPADESGQALTIDSVTQPAHGFAANNGDGTVTYTPDLNYNGSDSLTYRVCDNGSPSQCDTGSLSVTVGAANDPPVANDDIATTNEDISLNINVVANDSDPEGNLNPSSVSILAGPFNGSGNNPGNGTVTYAPNANWNGVDFFLYQVCDTLAVCDNATVSITVSSVNDPPVATNDSTSTNEDTPVTLNVVTNDSPGPADESGQSLTIDSVTQPAHGSASSNGNGTVTYTPEANYNGSDSFTYDVCDNGVPVQCDTGTVNVTINAVNDPPVANDDTPSTNEDNPVTVNVVSNDSPGPANESSQSLSVTSGSVTDPPNGTATDNGNGTVTYTPSPDYNGPDSFTYEVCDNGSPVLCDTAIVNVTVTAVNDPPVADDETDSTQEDTPVTISVKPGDSPGPADESSQALDVTSASNPPNGSAVVNGDDTVTYTPDADYNGSDSFTYEVCDNGTPIQCDTASVTVTVTAVNDAPVADDETASTDEDAAVIVNVLAGDTPGPANESGQSLSVTAVSDPPNGTTANNGDGTVTYTPDTDFAGIDTFTYTVCDNGSPVLCNTGSVTVTVNNLFKLTIIKNGTGTVTSIPTGISCGADCSEKYAQDQSVALTASGGVFTGWGGDVPASCTAAPLPTCTVIMDQDRTVIANFV